MKKSSKKGFILAETITVSVVIMIVLIVIYTQFIKVNNSFYISFKYNNVDKLYLVNNIRDYIDTENKETIYNNINEYGYLDITNCSSSYFVEYLYCSNLMKSANVKQALITIGDTTSILENIKGKELVSEDMFTYLKNNENSENYKIIVEFNDNTIASLNLEKTMDVYNFYYTGDVQTFKAPVSGQYKLEVWGAQGGGYDSTREDQPSDGEIGYPGLGGYSTGVITLNKDDELHVYVGGAGTYCFNTCTAPGGWNGGGDGYKLTNTDFDPGVSGGGATDIRIVKANWNDTASLLSRFIVAGAGGGGGMDGNRESTYDGYDRGGSGGGLTGVRFDTSVGEAGTQTSGYAFGYGFSANAENNDNTFGRTGAGGGWYGGFAETYHGGGGGSGFVLTSDTASNVPVGYSVSEKYYLTNAKTVDGNSSIPTHDGSGTMIGNTGNGFAKITLLIPQS